MSLVLFCFVYGSCCSDWWPVMLSMTTPQDISELYLFILQFWFPIQPDKVYPVLWRSRIPWLSSLRWRPKPEQFCFCFHVLWLPIWDRQSKFSPSLHKGTIQNLRKRKISNLSILFFQGYRFHKAYLAKVVCFNCLYLLLSLLTLPKK